MINDDLEWKKNTLFLNFRNVSFKKLPFPVFHESCFQFKKTSNNKIAATLFCKIGNTHANLNQGRGGATIKPPFTLLQPFTRPQSKHKYIHKKYGDLSLEAQIWLKFSLKSLKTFQNISSKAPIQPLKKTNLN